MRPLQQIWDFGHTDEQRFRGVFHIYLSIEDRHRGRQLLVPLARQLATRVVGALARRLCELSGRRSLG